MKLLVFQHIACEHPGSLRTYLGKDGVENPIVVRALKEDLLARGRVDGPHRAVGAAEGNYFSIG